MSFVLRPTTVEIQQKLLYSYQRNPKMALLTVKTGGGKTYGAIHTFGSIIPDATLLVFTTAKIVHSKQWEKSVKDYNQVMHTNLKIICLNYDKLVSQRAINDLYHRLTLMKFNKVVLILDEIHRIKMASNGKLSQRSQMLLRLARQPFIVTTLGLSATAFSNSYLDVAPYLIIAGYYPNKSQFLKQHIKRYNDYFQPIVTDQSGHVSRDAFINPDQIDREIRSITVYVDTKRYKPKVDMHHIRFKLNHDERSLYNEIEIAYKNKEYDFPIQARMDQERMLAYELGTQKDIYLLGLIEARDKHKFYQIAPILIFYQYTSICIHIKNLLNYYFPDKKVVIINGKHHENDKLLTKPPTDDSIYLIQYEAGGEGLDLQWSNMSVFYEAPVKYEKFVQAKGRNVRNKSQMPLVYQYELEYINTLDSDRWKASESKKDFTDEVSELTFLKGLKNEDQKNSSATRRASSCRGRL